MRRCGTALVALALLAAIVAGCGCGEVARPDLLLISIDTLRPDRLACYGGADDVGTAMCSLGDAGVRYAWAFSAAPSTPPSIASLHTSRLPRDHGVTDIATSRLADEAVTLAEALAAGGYATAAFVANPVLVRGRGFEQGFAIYDSQMRRRERNRRLFEREAGEVTDAALAWVRAARSPWFLWIHYQDPHGPYQTPYAAIARDAGTPQDGSALPVLTDQSGWRGIPGYQVLDGARAPATYEARYADEIRHVDGQLARLFAALDARETRPSILLTADHGEAFGEDEFWFAHGHSLAIDQIRIPLFWRPSEPEPGRVVATPVSNLDVAPTLLAAAGLPRQPGFEGIPLAAREAVSGATPIFAEHRLRAAVVVGNQYFARDRIPFTEPVREAVTGGLVPPFPPRMATLAADGRFAGYTLIAPDAAPELEALVAAFLAQSPAREAGSQRVLDESAREALRALGYLE